jgi:hypothetical protein
VLLVLAAIVLIGGGRKLLRARRARAAVDRLDGTDVEPAAIEAMPAHGRAGLIDLFRLLAEGDRAEIRDAAGRALAVLWARDEMIGEEEKGVVRRGYHVRWIARRRYPRAIRAEVPVVVEFGVPFLTSGGEGVGPENLEWSYKVVGAKRASLEIYSPWAAGPGRAAFTIIPSDFETEGPHRLVLQARVRTIGLTSSWELELPHVPFSFEFDPRLAVESILALPDDARAVVFARSVRLTVGGAAGGEGDSAAGPGVLPLDDCMAILDPPAIEVATPVPCDLAHAVEVGFDGVDGWFPAGFVAVSGQGGPAPAAPGVVRVPIGRPVGLPAGAIDRPGRRRVRARLTPAPDRGWADPEVRSLWPGMIEIDWVEVEVVRL